MRIRRAFVGLATVVTTLTTSVPASALTCFWPPMEHAALTADSVIEATIAARRPVHRVLNAVLAWFDGSASLQFERFELVLDDVQVLRGSPARAIQTHYEYLAPGGRYVFIANRRWFGPLSIRLCSGYAIEVAKASELKGWLASLPRREPTERP